MDTSEKPELIYDFYNFPQRYYEQTWDHQGSPLVAEKVIGLLKQVCHCILLWRYRLVTQCLFRLGSRQQDNNMAMIMVYGCLWSVQCNPIRTFPLLKYLLLDTRIWQCIPRWVKHLLPSGEFEYAYVWKIDHSSMHIQRWEYCDYWQWQCSTQSTWSLVFCWEAHSIIRRRLWQANGETSLYSSCKSFVYCSMIQ